MTNLAEEYQALSRRREGIVSSIAVQRANEERKKKEREEIEAELRAAGIDPTKPDEEIARLTKELEDNRNRISKELDELENLLAPKASQPEPEPTHPVDILKDACDRLDEPDTEAEAEVRAHLDEKVTIPHTSDAEDILID